MDVRVCVRNAAMMYMDACHNPAGEGIAIIFISNSYTDLYTWGHSTLGVTHSGGQFDCYLCH